MLVILKRHWFAGIQYRSMGKSPVQIPDKYFKQLPKDAVVVEAPKDKVPVEDDPDKVSASGATVEKYVNPAHALDPDRAYAESLSEVNAEAKAQADGDQAKVEDLRTKFKF